MHYATNIAFPSSPVEEDMTDESENSLEPMETAFSLDQTADGKFLSLDDLGKLLLHLASQGLLCLHMLCENRDFKIWYGEAVVRRQIVKITPGDVMSRVPLRLSRRSLAFYYGKVPSFTYFSLHECKPAVYFSFLTLFSLFEQPSSKIKYSIIKFRSKITVSLSFVRKI